MKLSTKSLALAMGILWGGAILLVGLGNLVWSGYGDDFLEVLSDVYPGVTDPEDETGLGNVLLATFWGVIDGLIGGALIAILYNFFAGRKD